MSIAHVSKFGLALTSATEYFQAFWPVQRDLLQVCNAVKARRKVPVNILRLADNARAWGKRHDYALENFPDFSDYYDKELRELNPLTGEVLTDEQILETWSTITGEPARFEPIPDIELPPGGLPDPDAWTPPIYEEDPQETFTISREQALADIRSHGIARTADEYGIEGGAEMTEDQLAEAISRVLLT